MSMEDALYLFKKTTMYTKFWNYEFCFLKIPCHITAIFHFEEKNMSWKFNPFHATGLFIYPPKTSENL